MLKKSASSLKILNKIAPKYKKNAIRMAFFSAIISNIGKKYKPKPFLMFLGMTQLGERKGNNLMQLKSEISESVIAEGKDFQEFILPVNSPELMKLLAQSKYYGREPRDRVQLDDALVKLFQVAFEIDIKTCTEDEWTERISIKGGALKQWQSLIKDRE